MQPLRINRYGQGRHVESILCVIDVVGHSPVASLSILATVLTLSGIYIRMQTWVLIVFSLWGFHVWNLYIYPLKICVQFMILHIQLLKQLEGPSQLEVKFLIILSWHHWGGRRHLRRGLCFDGLRWDLLLGERRFLIFQFALKESYSFYTKISQRCWILLSKRSKMSLNCILRCDMHEWGSLKIYPQSLHAS